MEHGALRTDIVLSTNTSRTWENFFSWRLSEVFWSFSFLSNGNDVLARKHDVNGGLDNETRERMYEVYKSRWLLVRPFC